MQLDRFHLARPHLIRAALGSVALVVAAMVTSAYGQIKCYCADQAQGIKPDYATDTERLIAVGGAILILIAGVIVVRAIAAAIRSVANEPGEARRTGPLALIVSAIGYLFVVLILLGALHISVTKVLLGTALTGIILGIAAQQSLGNFFAGIVLLAVRPFSVGERVVMRSGPLGGEYEGVVTEMSLFYVHMITDTGPLLLPNAVVLGASIGPGARSVDADADPDKSQDPGVAQGGTAAAG